MKRVWALGLASVVAAASAAWAKEAPVRRPAPSVSPAVPAAPEGGPAEQVGLLNRRLYDLIDRLRYDEAFPVAIEALRLQPESGTGWYNLARIQARMGRPDGALDSLNAAIRFGFCDLCRLRRDPALEGLHAAAGYAKILDRNAEIQRARAERIGRQLQGQFGDDYVVQVDHTARLVLVTNVDPAMLSELREYLSSYARAMWRDLFGHSFEQYVTVILPAGVAGDLPVPGGGVGGYYEHAQRLLVARQAGKVMTHEFTHALHAADQDELGQAHPIWVAEGLATMFESSAIADGHAVPEANHRLTLLKYILRRDGAVRWRRMVAFDHDEFLGVSAVSYPQCRYMMMYLYEKGLLKKWYDAFTAGYGRDPTGLIALEEVFGKPLEEIEADWKRWVSGLESPPVRLRDDGAYMGVETLAMADGLLVVRVLEGSGAAAAGIRPGDLIVGVDGQRVADGPKLLRLVTAKGVGKTIQVRYRRDGKYLTAPVALGRWKGDSPPPAAKAVREKKPA